MKKVIWYNKFIDKEMNFFYIILSMLIMINVVLFFWGRYDDISR